MSCLKNLFKKSDGNEGYESDSDNEIFVYIDDDETEVRPDDRSDHSVGLYNKMKKVNPNQYKQLWITELDHVLPVSVYKEIKRTNEGKVYFWKEIDDLPVVKITGIVHRNMRSTGSSEISRKYREKLVELVVKEGIAEALKVCFKDQIMTTIQVRKELHDEINYESLGGEYSQKNELKKLRDRQKRLIKKLCSDEIITKKMKEDLISYINSDEECQIIRDFKKKMNIPKHYKKMFKERKFLRTLEE